MKNSLSVVGLLLFFICIVYCSSSLQFDDIFYRFSVQDYLIYNDSTLITLLNNYTPSKVFCYINDIFSSSHLITEENIPLLYALATVTFDLHDCVGAKELFLKINETLPVISELMIVNKHIEEVGHSVQSYIDHSKSLPDNRFFYRWSSNNNENLTKYKTSSTLDVQIQSFVKFYDRYSFNKTKLQEFIRLVAIETGRVENVYHLSDLTVNQMTKNGIDSITKQENDRSKSEDIIINKIINSHLNVLYNQSINEDVESIKFVHREIVRHAPFHSVYSPELKQKIRILIPQGRFKNVPNSPTRNDGLLFEFCPPNEVENQLNILINIINGLNYVHPIVLAAYIHKQLIKIHPFIDGNGRMTRTIVSSFLVKHGYLPLLVTIHDKKSYIEASEKTIVQDDLQPLIDYIYEHQMFALNNFLIPEFTCKHTKYFHKMCY